MHFRPGDGSGAKDVLARQSDGRNGDHSGSEEIWVSGDKNINDGDNSFELIHTVYTFRFLIGSLTCGILRY